MSFRTLTTMVSIGREAEQDGEGATEEGARSDRHGQGRGDRGPDARSRTILLSNTGHGSENGAHHKLGRRSVRLHAQPSGDWPLTVPQIAQMRPTSRQRMQRL